MVYLNHEVEIERGQKSRMKSSLITRSTTAHFYMPISNAAHNETISHRQQNSRRFVGRKCILYLPLRLCLHFSLFHVHLHCYGRFSFEHLFHYTFRFFQHSSSRLLMIFFCPSSQVISSHQAKSFTFPFLFLTKYSQKWILVRIAAVPSIRCFGFPLQLSLARAEPQKE